MGRSHDKSVTLSHPAPPCYHTRVIPADEIETTGSDCFDEVKCDLAISCNLAILTMILTCLRKIETNS